MQPTITTPRLLLRPFCPADAPAVQRLAGEYEIALNTALVPHPYPDGAAEAFIATLAAAYERGDSACFAIVLAAEQELIGSIGLTFDRPHRRAELGFWTGKPYWGQGYTTEAARAIVDWGFRTQDLLRVWAGHFARNEASGRVQAKIGMRVEGVLRQHFIKWGEPQDVVHYGVLRAEWLT